MKHESLKISKMVAELMNYLFYMGASDINIDFKESEEYYKITAKSNYEEGSEKKVEKLTKLLDSPKHEEIEEYYWTLTGDCDVSNELSLVGMMCDKYKVNFEDGNKIQIVLYRYKK